MPEPLVSAVVPVFNGERHLRATLESVLAQTRPADEVVVVDDGSTDGSVEVARAIPGVRVVSQANAGPAAARNAGVAAARGALIAFLDVDDEWTPDKLRVQVGLHVSRPDLGHSFTFRRLRVAPERIAPGYERFAVPHAGIHCSTLMVRRDFFEAVGPFREDLRIGEDADWFARAGERAGGRTVIPDVLLLHRLVDKHGPRYREKMRQGLVRALKASMDRKRGGA